jgi:hypothetical protein
VGRIPPQCRGAEVNACHCACGGDPVRSARIDSGDAVDAAMRTREQHLLRLNEQYGAH